MTAIKVIVHQQDPARFDREVLALESISSNRVVGVVGHGHLTVQGVTYPWIESEFIAGGDVRAAIPGGISDADLRAFIKGCLEGIGVLHAAHVVHRDLKPENIMLRGGLWSDPVIIDLGLSRLMDESSLTIYPWAGGTWPYMAPEQIRGERAGYRSDVWALGVIAAELGSGTHPFYRPGDAPVPPDWLDRLEAGVTMPPARPAGLELWLQDAMGYRAYRRPTAAGAIDLLDRVWP
jgi:eukaryotic-like serine/threonine-protein kinase